MSEGRKSSKPLMEKRRRARINDSLGQLKSLILEATNKDTSRHSKLEKADILEMTVKYLRNMQRHQISGSGNPDPAMLNRYRLGYSECINEVSRYLDTSESATQIRTQLIGHLADTVNASPTTTQQQQQQPQSVAYTPAPTASPVVAQAAMGPTPQQPTIVQIAPSTTYTATPTDGAQNISAARVVSGIQVGVPSGMSGEITVVLPPQSFPGGQLPSHFIPVYAQNIPSLLSPASSTSSTCLPSPTSSVETRVTPTHQTSYVYQQLAPKQELSPVSYETRQQVVSQQSYYPGTVSPAAPVSTTVHHIQSPTLVSPTLVAMPANLLTHAAEPQQHRMQIEQPLSPPKTILRTVNIHVPHQQPCVEDENVWRPW